MTIQPWFSARRCRLAAISFLLSLASLSDGASVTTASLVKDIHPSGDSGVGWMAGVNGMVYFSASDGVHGVELWKSDGTDAGTTMVKDIHPAGDSYPTWLVDVNGTLFFIATDAADEYELWKSDGTEAGTVMVKNINGPESSYASSLTAVNGTLYFVAYGSSLTGYEVWKSDGTAAGTVMVKDIHPTGGSNPYHLTDINGVLYFGANDGVHGVELWKSDGTDAGTVMVKDIHPTQHGFPYSLTAANGKVYFNAYDDNDSLWTSDGTEAGTVKVLNTPGGSMVNCSGILYFTVNGALWASHGTATETFVVKNLNPAGYNTIFQLTTVNYRLYFTANAGDGMELWTSDGTEGGTVKVKDFHSDPGYQLWNLTSVGGVVYFVADDGVHGRELWTSDGTEAGTRLVRDIHPAGDAGIERITSVGWTLYFVANDGMHGQELWQTLWVELNDECFEATAIKAGLRYAGYNAGAGGISSSHCGYNDTADVWYSFQPTVGGDYTVSVSSTNFDTTLAVYNTCGGTELACNDDYFGQSTDSQVILATVKGKRYLIRVAGFNGQSGSFELGVSAGSCSERAVSDLNGDCAVNVQDFVIMASEWLTCTRSPASLCE